MRWASGWRWALALLALPAAAAAQHGPDLNVLALHWAQGRFGAPMLCSGEEGSSYHLLRRIRIDPGPRGRLPATARIRFRGLEELPAESCVSELGEPEPDVLGTLEIRLEGHSRPDLANRDFRDRMRREGGFDFHVASGRLRVGEIGKDEGRVVDFRGGAARLHQARPGTDAHRLLQSYDAPRRLVLELVAPDGTELEFWMIQTDRPRTPGPGA